MTTLENRPNTALLVIDVQNGVVDGAYERDTIVANVGTVVEKARAADVPVVWVQHSSDNLPKGSEQWRIVPELSPDESEPLVPKRYPDSFEETTLESDPRRPRRRRLVVVGAQTDECVRSTLHGALVRGYDATLVSDAHTTEDLSPWGRRRRISSSRTRISTGATMRRRGGRPARSKRRTSTSQAS
jgi:Amidases related to nicotinamidase